MKNLLLIFTLLFSVSVYARDSIIQQGIQEIDTSSVSNQMYQDLKSGMSSIAAALKVGTEHVYKLLIKQQIIDSIIWLVCILILTVIPQFYRKKLWGIIKKDDRDSSQPFIFLYFLPVGIGIFVFFMTISTILTGFLNPEYGAIKEIVNMTKSITH